MHSVRRLTLAVLLVWLCGCPPAGGPSDASPAVSPSPTPLGERFVPNGYNGMSWLTPKAEVQRVVHNLTKPEGAQSNVLVREHELNGRPAREAYFFNDDDLLVEVELRVAPKLTPEESAELAMWFDSRFGPHGISRSDESRYQFVWSGADTEVYFTYDLTAAVPEAPHVNFTYRNPEAGTQTGPTPAEQFAADALKALSDGWNVVEVIGGKTRFVLLLGKSGDRRKLMLELDPESGHTIGYKRETPYSTGVIGSAQRDAERHLTVRLATVGGPIAVIERDGLLYAIFEDGSYVALKPGAKNIFQEAAGSLPPFLDALPLPTLAPMETPETVETAVP